MDESLNGCVIPSPSITHRNCQWPQAAGENNANLAIYSLAFLLTTLGIVYVQEAERKIPMNYANRYRAGALSRQSYLPFKASHIYWARPERTSTCLHCKLPVSPSPLLV